MKSPVIRVATGALAHAGIDAREVDEIYLGHFNAGFWQQDFTASLVLQADGGFRFKPATRVEGACTTGSAAAGAGASRRSTEADGLLSGFGRCRGADRRPGLPADVAMRQRPLGGVRQGLERGVASGRPMAVGPVAGRDARLLHHRGSDRVRGDGPGPRGAGRPIGATRVSMHVLSAMQLRNEAGDIQVMDRGSPASSTGAMLR